MNDTLLMTKLSIPPTGPHLVPRRQLIDRLSKGLVGKLTLISAPAGFGKTTLLSQWLTQADVSAAWISLDEGDNDPARFIAYFSAAAKLLGVDATNAPSFTLPAAAGLGTSNVVAILEAFLVNLINQVDQSAPSLTMPGQRPFLLVLDDYHLINAAVIHQALAFLIDHLPPQMHLVIGTRADPPLPIARLRGQGQVNEIRLRDLRFTPTEAKRFLEEAAGMTLPDVDAATLTRCTEGWIAGLQMAAVSMKGQASQVDVTRFIQAFSGSNRHVLDYLMEEVIHHQDAPRQNFLLHSSILRRLTGPLCDAVVGRTREKDMLSGDSQATLEALERANLFIVPLDQERRWYRYHRLFADMLRKRLQQSQPELLPLLHLRASIWYEQQGYLAEAIDHAFEAADTERSAELVNRQAEETLMRSELATLMNWVDRLPKALLGAYPRLCLYASWGQLLNGRSFSEVEAQLERIDNMGTPDSSAPIRAFIAFYQGHFTLAEELARQTLERWPSEESFFRSLALWLSSYLKMADGDLSNATRALDEALILGQQRDNSFMAIALMNHRAGIERRQGQLHEALATYERILDKAADDQGRLLPIAGKIMMGLGELWREWNDLPKAAHFLEEGIALTGQWSEFASMEGYLTLARVRQAQGDEAAASQAMAKAIELALQFDVSDWDDIVAAADQARLWLTQGKEQAVSQWVEQRGLADKSLAQSEPGTLDATIEYQLRRREQLVLGRLLIRQNQCEKALTLLESQLPSLQDQGRVANEIEIHILQALAWQGAGDEAQALRQLELALSMAEPGGYLRIFLDEGTPMAQLLYRAAEQGIKPEYTGKLLAASQAIQADEAASIQDPAAEIVEPLSEREREVLQLVAAGLSNREIARKLVLSISTVKAHTYNIYGKLGVHSRTQAVHRANALGILPLL